MIAIKSSLDLKPSVIKSNCKAEFLSVTLSAPNRKKACLSTCYRVGTLGESNLNVLKSRFNEISRTRSII